MVKAPAVFLLSLALAGCAMAPQAKLAPPWSSAKVASVRNSSPKTRGWPRHRIEAAAPRHYPLSRSSFRTTNDAHIIFGAPAQHSRRNIIARSLHHLAGDQLPGCAPPLSHFHTIVVKPRAHGWPGLFGHKLRAS